MNSTALFAQIKILLYRLADDIESSNALHLHNDAIHAENFLAELLNLVFSWNLENGNRVKLNQETFDLVDKSKGIYVQVTSNKSHLSKYNKVIIDKLLLVSSSDVVERTRQHENVISAAIAWVPNTFYIPALNAKMRQHHRPLILLQTKFLIPLMV